MRLINVDTLEMKSFGDDPPPYAILSHRWSDDELSFQDFHDLGKRRGRGFEKITGFCSLICRLRQQAQQAGDPSGVAMTDPAEKAADYATDDQHRVCKVDWAWVDTIDIDKSSSSELSEAINSMWRYYAGSAICIAYLGDVADTDPSVLPESEWLTRGWTLQELLAPVTLLQAGAFWCRLVEFKPTSSGETVVISTSVAQRMSWAARRVTTRGEDMAYCLTGVIDVDMPLLYGEGLEKAFLRLQTVIIRQSDDESRFVFNPQLDSDFPCSGALARHPLEFETSNHIRTQVEIDRRPYMVTNRGLQIEGPAIRVHTSADSNYFVLKLNCARFSPSASEESPGISCIMAVHRIGHVPFRDPGFEQAVAQTTAGRVKQLITDGAWELVESQHFFVVLEYYGALSARLRARRRSRKFDRDRAMGRDNGETRWFDGIPDKDHTRPEQVIEMSVETQDTE